MRLKILNWIKSDLLDWNEKKILDSEGLCLNGMHWNLKGLDVKRLHQKEMDLTGKERNG